MAGLGSVVAAALVAVQYDDGSFSLACQDFGEGSMSNSLPESLFFPLQSGDKHTRTTSIHASKSSPQWLSELRRLWRSVP